MNELHLFAGAGGGILGGVLLGHTCVCAVEINSYRRKILLQRQKDGVLPWFPIWDDVRTFEGWPWKGFVDIVCSGFPCQRHSNIGKIFGSDGFDGWPDTARIVEETKPRWVFLENVPAILSGYWWGIIGRLSDLGYDTRWGVFCCPDTANNAPTIGGRLFALSKARSLRLETGKLGLGFSSKVWKPSLPAATTCPKWTQGMVEPTISRVVDGMADYVDEIEAIGDGQVPAVVKLAWETLNQ